MKCIRSFSTSSPASSSCWRRHRHDCCHKAHTHRPQKEGVVHEAADSMEALAADLPRLKALAAEPDA